MHVDDVHLRQAGEVEVFAPEAQLGFLFGRGAREQRFVQAQLAEISLFVHQPFGLEDPDFQRVFRAANVFLIGLDGLSQTVNGRVLKKFFFFFSNESGGSPSPTTNLYTHLSRSSAVRHEKYLVLPAGNVT